MEDCIKWYQRQACVQKIAAMSEEIRREDIEKLAQTMTEFVVMARDGSQDIHQAVVNTKRGREGPLDPPDH